MFKKKSENKKQIGSKDKDKKNEEAINMDVEKKKKKTKKYHEGLEIIKEETQVVNGVEHKKLILINGTSVLL